MTGIDANKLKIGDRVYPINCSAKRDQYSDIILVGNDNLKNLDSAYYNINAKYGEYSIITPTPGIFNWLKKEGIPIKTIVRDNSGNLQRVYFCDLDILATEYRRRMAYYTPHQLVLCSKKKM